MRYSKMKNSNGNEKREIGKGKTIKGFRDLDVYSKFVDVKTCEELIDSYDMSCRQLTNLRKAWKNFHENR